MVVELCKEKSVLFISILVGTLFACEPEVPQELATDYSNLPDQIDFNYHVKPIISDKCYSCHGPDANSRKAEFRLDTEEGAFATLSSGGHAFVANKPSESTALQRILSEDPTFQMPPPESNLLLTSREKAVLYKWVKQGASWKKHWAFIPPQKSELPKDLPKDWKVVNEVDQFVYQKLVENGLSPSPPADKERLLRRVTMDLTGLPPTISEIDAFLSDSSPDAYERVVDKLLASVTCAERLTNEWLDVARYADSHGLHADGYRLMWPWRDWVINAFEKNMPYDEFVVTQLAGDLLPDATQGQILATAFNRNHPMTDEGGVVDEEFRLKYVADRTSTTATAFLGLTMECASCHDHKFDPISQKEFYQMSAFFNNIDEIGMTGADGNYGPNLLLEDEKSGLKIEELKKFIAELEMNKVTKEKEVSDVHPLRLPAPRANEISDQIAYYPLESSTTFKSGFALDRNTKSTTKSQPVFTEGKRGKAIRFTGEYDELSLYGVGRFEAYDPFSVSVWINTTKRQPGKTQTIIGNTGQKNNFWRGWDLYLDDQNTINFRLVNSLPHSYIRVKTVDSLRLNQWVHIVAAYNGSSQAKGLQIFVNGKEAKTEIVYDRLIKTILPIKIASHLPDDRPLRVAKSYRLHTGEFGIFKGAIDEIRIFQKQLSNLEAAVLFNEDQHGESKLNYDEEWYKQHSLMNSKEVKLLNEQLKSVRKELLDVINPIDEVMVMEEMKQPRKTFVLNRGLYDSPGEQVEPGTPSAVLPFPKELPPNRLGLAKWLFKEDNPLTARVTVNRYWQMIMGKGLVKTTNDFGNQGDLPTHPELLDWLAVDFMESGWDVKYLLKKIVTSSSYMQSSAATKEMREKDPENIWLARSPSYRWPAEFIRDNALAASGLLVEQVGGRSVKPYQPDGLWRELSNYSRMLLTYKQDSGRNLYRRSMYTFIRRTSPPPFMTVFDAPNRDICAVQREKTNTPLQALTLLNDPQFVEAAKVLAERILTTKTDETKDRIALAFRLSTSRKPTQKEIQILDNLYQQQYQWYAQNSKYADDLLAVGDHKIAGDINRQQAAAMTIVASTILNHDETYMKR